MISAAMSLAAGILSLFCPVPFILPVFGLAMGANAIIKEKKKANKRKIVKVMATTGLAASGSVILMVMLRTFLG